MKLVWHIIKKDLRAVWLVALGWLSLIALRIPLLLYVLNMKVVDERTLRFLPLISGCAIFGDVLLIFSVVRSLVHEDALAGDKAFWITRPVKGGQLLAAKVMNLLLICVVCPLVLLVPTWFVFGFNGAEILHAAVFQVFLNTGLAIAALVFAVVTRQAGSFWIALVSTGVAVVIASTASNAAGLLSIPEDLVKTRLWLAALFCLGLISIGIVHQFKKRSMFVTIGCFALGAISFLIVMGCWPWKIAFFDRISNRQPWISQPVMIEWQGEKIQLSTLAKSSETSSLPVLVKAEFLVTVPWQYGSIGLSLTEGQWTYAKEKSKPAEMVSWNKYNGLTPLAVYGRPWKHADGTYSCVIPVSFNANWLWKKDQPWEQAGFVGQFGIEFSKTITLPNLELIPGAKVQSGAYVVRLVSAKPYKNVVKISLLEVSPSGSSNQSVNLVDTHGLTMGAGSSSRNEMSSWLLGITIKQIQVIYRSRKSEPTESDAPINNRSYEDDTQMGEETQENLAERGWHIVKTFDQRVGYCTYDLKVEKLKIVRETVSAK